MKNRKKFHFVYNQIDRQYGLDVILSEVSAALADMNASIKALKDSAVTIFSSGSLVVAIMGAFQIFDRTVLPQYEVLYKILTFASVALYLPLLGFSLTTILPITIETPIKPQWDELHDAYWDKTKIYIIRKRIISYTNAIERNAKVIKRHKSYVVWSAIWLGLIILCLLGARLLP